MGLMSPARESRDGSSGRKPVTEVEGKTGSARAFRGDGGGGGAGERGRGIETTYLSS
jgi:hypothetical protein